MRVSGGSLADLESRIHERTADPAQAFADEVSFTRDKLFRLAIVAGNPDDLKQKLTLAASQLSNPKSHAALGEKGIFPGVAMPTRPKIAFLFPGQGSQYDGMLKSLVEDCPAAAAAMAADRRRAGRYAIAGPSPISPGRENSGLGEDVWRTQLSLLVADFITYAAATSVGLQPDRVAGHSFGELVALAAAGSWTFEDAVRATRARCRSIDGCENANGLLVSTNAKAEVVEELCSRVGGRISVSHFNAPEQTVAGGDKEAVKQLAALLKEQGLLSKILDVPAAFHTPLMEEVKVPFGQALAEIPTGPPLIPLLSSVTNRYVAEPSEIRQKPRRSDDGDPSTTYNSPGDSPMRASRSWSRSGRGRY